MYIQEGGIERSDIEEDNVMTETQGYAARFKDVGKDHEPEREVNASGSLPNREETRKDSPLDPTERGPAKTLTLARGN